MTLRLPPPADRNAQASADESPNQGKRPRTKLLTEDEILQALTDLNGLVTLNIISAIKANVIQRGLRIMLDVYARRARQAPEGLPQETLAELCKTHPDVVNLLENILSAQQVAWLLSGKEGQP